MLQLGGSQFNLIKGISTILQSVYSRGVREGAGML
jgi:hypothetical protein